MLAVRRVLTRKREPRLTPLSYKIQGDQAVVVDIKCLRTEGTVILPQRAF